MKQVFQECALGFIIYKFIFAILMTLMFALDAFSQTSEKCFRGTVKDANDAVIVGAEILLKNAKGKTIDKTESNSLGEFALNCFEVGEYVLQISKSGMAEVRKNISLKDKNLEISDIVLETQAVSETVTVKIEPEFVSSIIESATKTATPLRDIPQSVEIVNRSLIESQGARSLQDALYNVTAVSVAQGEGRRDQFFIRGFSATGDQFIDGVRDDSLYYRDLSNIEQVEVVKGPSAVLFGRGSSGGIINRVTKRPNYFGRVGSAELMFGSYGLKRGVFDYGQPILQDKLAFRFVGALEKSESFRKYFYLERYNIAPSLSWKPTEKTDVLFQFEYLNDERVPDRGIPSYGGRPVDVPIDTYYGYPEEDHIKNRVSSQGIKVEHHFNNGWLIRNYFRRIDTSTDFYNTVPGAVSLVGGQLRVARTQYNGIFNQENYFNQTETVGNFKTFGIEHTLLAGVELGSQEKESLVFRNGVAASVLLFNPILTRPVNNGIPTTDNNFEGKVFGAYFQDQIAFSNQWKALIGARYDNFKQKLDDLSKANVDLGRTDREWSPRVGLIYQPREWLSFYTSYTRSFQPSGENLSLAVNNDELEPEMTRNYEAGIKAQIQPLNLNTTFSLFRLDRTNIKTTDPLDTTKLLLVGQQRTNGMEITVSGSPWRKLEIYAGYAFLDAKILKSNTISSGVSLQGKLAQLTPRNSGNLWLTYQLPKQFRLGFGAFARSDVFTSANNLVILPGFVRFDVALSWRSERHYEIAFNLKNIANRRYYETSNGDNGIMPGSPINGVVTLRYRW